MKIFISLVTACCFSFSVLAGASIHTLIEAEIEQDRENTIAVSLVHMKLRDLAEYRVF